MTTAQLTGVRHLLQTLAPRPSRPLARLRWLHQTATLALQAAAADLYAGQHPAAGMNTLADALADGLTEDVEEFLHRLGRSPLAVALQGKPDSYTPAPAAVGLLSEIRDAGSLLHMSADDPGRIAADEMVTHAEQMAEVWKAAVPALRVATLPGGLLPTDAATATERLRWAAECTVALLTDAAITVPARQFVPGRAIEAARTMSDVLGVPAVSAECSVSPALAEVRQAVTTAVLALLWEAHGSADAAPAPACDRDVRSAALTTAAVRLSTTLRASGLGVENPFPAARSEQAAALTRAAEYRAEADAATEQAAALLANPRANRADVARASALLALATARRQQAAQQ